LIPLTRVRNHFITEGRTGWDSARTYRVEARGSSASVVIDSTSIHMAPISAASWSRSALLARPVQVAVHGSVVLLSAPPSPRTIVLDRRGGGTQRGQGAALPRTGAASQSGWSGSRARRASRAFRDVHRPPSSLRRPLRSPSPSGRYPCRSRSVERGSDTSTDPPPVPSDHPGGRASGARRQRVAFGNFPPGCRFAAGPFDALPE
jgi:hypothetical protein